MISGPLKRTLVEVLSLPTAPFAERYIIRYVKAFCESRKGLTVKVDGAGNLLVHLRRGRSRISRPVCFTAHLDHPGFVAKKMVGAKVQAIWRGGVKPPYFVGSKVRFFDDATERWIKGTVQSIKTAGKGAARKPVSATIAVNREVAPGFIGMWDLPDPVIQGDRIHARACDDLAGVAAMLCCIDRMSRSESAEAYFLFTRAEEVGFAGALAACRLKTIPSKCLVVAVETSAELPNARMGDGPILRVGDRLSVYTPAVTDHFGRVAQKIASRKKSFKYQRKLMDGGACEATAYCRRGLDATGMCLALGNYHNMNTKRSRIGSEYVDLRDFENLVMWFEELCRPTIPFREDDPALAKRLAGLEQPKLLRKTRDGEKSGSYL